MLQKGSRSTTIFLVSEAINNMTTGISECWIFETNTLFLEHSLTGLPSNSKEKLACNLVLNKCRDCKYSCVVFSQGFIIFKSTRHSPTKASIQWLQIPFMPFISMGGIMIVPEVNSVDEVGLTCTYWFVKISTVLFVKKRVSNLWK